MIDQGLAAVLAIHQPLQRSPATLLHRCVAEEGVQNNEQEGTRLAGWLATGK